MNRNNQQKVPEKTDPEYVVYFYESGLSGQYRQRQRNLVDRPNHGLPATYDSDVLTDPNWLVPQTVDDVTRSGYLTVPESVTDSLPKGYGPVPQTVDDVIRRGYLAIPASEPETAPISDKKDTSRLALNDIIDQVKDRHRIYQQNINGIEVSKAKLVVSNTTAAFLGIPYPIGLVLSTSTLSIGLDKENLDLSTPSRAFLTGTWNSFNASSQASFKVTRIPPSSTKIFNASIPSWPMPP